MGFSKKHLVNLLWILVIHQNCLRTANCQEDDNSRCLPQKTFFALLHLPEVGTNLAAYSRMARVIQAKICLPSSIYVELFNDPVTRGHLDVMGRAQTYLEDSMPEELIEEKRSLATLAKNGDLPTSVRDRGRPIERSGAPAGFDSLSSESVDGLMKILADGGVEDRGNIAEIAAEYTLPNGELDLESLARDYPATTKRNVGALARDYALPMMNATGGKRNYGSVVRQYGLSSNKRNIGSLARDRMLPPSGKRNPEEFQRPYYFMSDDNAEKRNLGSVAAFSNHLRYGKRYIGALARSGDFPNRGGDKRNVAALARNGDAYGKRNVGTLARDWSLPPQNRHGRSLSVQELDAERFDHELQDLNNQNMKSKSSQAEKSEPKLALVQENATRKPIQTSAFEVELTNAKNDMIKNVMDGKRLKREIDYSDEYALPVLQSTNVFDYEDMIEALTGEYPNTEKRFMGRIPQMGPRPTTPPTRRLGR